MRRTSPVIKSFALAAALVLAVGTIAEARPGGGRGGFGSRGGNSWSSPPATTTAPRQAQPLPGPGYTTPQRGPMGAPAAQGSRFGGGLLGGLAAGFLGAGLFGMLTGSGFLSGMGSFLGLLGFLVQIALLVIVARFALNWWRNRNAPATAGAPREMLREAPRQSFDPRAAAPAGSGFGAAPAAPAAPATPVPMQPITLADADFNRFEALLGDIQLAYGRGDRASLARLATPEVANHLFADLDADARQGVVNKVSSPKLLQGDLAEAWSEPGGEYATVAMRFSVVDVMLDKASGRVVDGDPARPVEATEIWTFVREPGAGVDGWALSAIQQA